MKISFLNDLPADNILFMAKFFFLGIIYLFLFKIISIIKEDIRISRKSIKTFHRKGKCLEILSGEDSIEGAKGNTIPLAPFISFGRDPSNTIQIFDQMVSNRHARITLLKDDYFIEDLGSKNGTFVNEERLDRPRPLKEGDIIRIGTISMKFIPDN